MATKDSLRVAVVAAVPLTLRVFMRPHLEAMASRFSTTAICGGDLDGGGALPPEVVYRHVSIQRKISPLHDLIALWHLIQLFRTERYTLVHSITPKAGLLAMCAACLCDIPLRVHVFTGQVWATKSGLSRYVLKMLDRLIALLATHVLADSPSQREFIAVQGVANAEQVKVLADGSICGVDVARFKPNPLVRAKLRSELQIADDGVIALFMGRLVRDKGVLDLANAFVQISVDMPTLHLLIVGPDEESLTQELHRIVRDCRDRVHFVGMTDRPEDYMAAADFFCLPSYREGFGSVIIEAAATGLPAVASRIYGLTDAVEEGETGVLHEPGNVQQIGSALTLLVSNPVLRGQMGAAAQERALQKFSSSRVVAAQMEFYDELFSSLSAHGGCREARLRKRWIYPIMKRLFDCAVALSLLVILSPVILSVAALVRVRMGAPVIFRQLRPGLKGRTISVLKFRTMNDAVDSAGQLLPDAARLTGLGRWMRRLSLDELPQLINVLRGDMSLVGPRPLLMEYLPLYSSEQARRHDVRPGITGWAQVNGRNAISWEQKFVLDVWYVDHQSFWLDMKILFLTVRKVLARDGISQQGVATMTRFKGPEVEK